MCRILEIPRGLVYYKKKTRKCNSILENRIIKIFKDSKNNYGTRKIKAELDNEGIQVSRRKISGIMKKYSLVSKYTIKQFKVHKASCNNKKIENIVNRDFQNRKHLDVVVSDLTYVNVAGKWNYICLLINLFNREIIGYSSGKHKSAQLVYEAFLKTNCSLNDVNIFHTDRGSEFDNKIITEVLGAFNIKRSLSKKGCPYDNAVAEAAYKIIKTEFVEDKIFHSLNDLQVQLFDYVNWYNNHRLHGALNYMSPSRFKAKYHNKN